MSNACDYTRGGVHIQRHGADVPHTWRGGLDTSSAVCRYSKSGVALTPSTCTETVRRALLWRVTNCHAVTAVLVGLETLVALAGGAFISNVAVCGATFCLLRLFL